MGRKAFDAYWAELAPCSHVVQIYEDDHQFLDNLVEFVSGELVVGEAAIVIATPSHRRALEAGLVARGVEVAAAQATDQLILLDAEDTISQFLVNNWPADHLFEEVIGDVLARASRDGRKVRAFGEMVALMWAKGYCGATIRLEHLWTDLCRKKSFSLFCAYPKIGFAGNPAEDIARVCAAHSQTVEA